VEVHVRSTVLVAALAFVVTGLISAVSWYFVESRILNVR
jgi:peptidoglycan/LPS O-acetylase OafA/YrhL